jgi:serine/threonine protein kinase
MPLREDIIERASARLGTVLKGKWRLDAVIGIGDMASVYAATHRNQARVAIKLLHVDVALDAEVTARFLREGYVANAVGHPGTVRVLDDDVSEDKAVSGDGAFDRANAGHHAGPWSQTIFVGSRDRKFAIERVPRGDPR